jgi:hypothetical protein
MRIVTEREKTQIAAPTVFCLKQKKSQQDQNKTKEETRQGKKTERSFGFAFFEGAIFAFSSFFSTE